LARAYDSSVDQCIISELLSQDRITSGKLKKEIEIKLNRKLSPDVFYPHLNKMVSNKELVKEDQGRGGHVYYSISEVTKKQRQLRILKMDDKQAIFKKIYEKIFLYDFFEGLYKRTSLPGTYLGIYEDVVVPYDIIKRIIIDSESEFNDFLSKLNIVKEGILWGTMVIHPSEFANLIDDLQSSSQYFKERRKDYWNKMKGMSKVCDQRLRFCYPKENDKDLMIYALDTWEIRKKKKYDLTFKLIKTRYLVFMPGITVQDIMGDNEFDKDEIEDGIKKLEEGGLIKYKVYGREITYVVADNHLRDFINDLRDLFKNEFDFLLYRWKNFESPTLKETERMESIFGKERFRKIFINCQTKISKHREKMIKCADIEQYNEVLKENTEAEGLRTSLDICLDKYKDNRKKDPRNKKEHHQDIRNYKKYLKGRIDVALKDISYNNEVLEKYRFLHDIFRLIWPRIFEPVDEDQVPASQIQML
jgi:hypothetical protein